MSLQCVYVCLCLSMFINVYLCYFVDFKFTNKLYSYTKDVLLINCQYQLSLKTLVKLHGLKGLVTVMMCNHKKNKQN